MSRDADRRYRDALLGAGVTDPVTDQGTFDTARARLGPLTRVPSSQGTGKRIPPCLHCREPDLVRNFIGGSLRGTMSRRTVVQQDRAAGAVTDRTRTVSKT